MQEGNQRPFRFNGSRTSFRLNTPVLITLKFKTASTSPVICPNESVLNYSVLCCRNPVKEIAERLHAGGLLLDGIYHQKVRYFLLG